MDDLPYDPECLIYRLWAHMGGIVQIYEKTPTGHTFYATRPISSLSDDIRIPLLTAQRLGADPAELIHTEST